MRSIYNSKHLMSIPVCVNSEMLDECSIYIHHISSVVHKTKARVHKILLEISY
jgi:hypothetical protein